MKRTETKTVTLTHGQWTAVIKDNRAQLFFQNDRLFSIAVNRKNQDTHDLISLLAAALEEGN